MNIASLVLREIALRRWSALLAVLGVAAAATLFVVFFVVADASQRETRRITRDIGYNLRLVPKATDMAVFWEKGYSDHTMPVSHLDRLATQRKLSYNHLIGFLQREITLGDRRFVLTGISGEKSPPGKKKPSMIFRIATGTTHLGSEVARALNLKRGDVLTITDHELRVADHEFQIAEVLSETGTPDDVKVWLDLADAQRVLGEDGRINEIKAIDCLCLEPAHDPVGQLREQTARLLPDVRLVQLEAMAEARARQRSTSTRQFAFLLPFALILGAVWIVVLAMLNVRDRLPEIGVFRSLGYGKMTVLGLFLGRAALVGAIGGAIGVVVGHFLAHAIGPEIFKLTSKAMKTESSLVWGTLVAAPLFATAASFVPALSAALRPPADILRQEAA